MKHSSPEARILLACLSSRPVPQYVLAAMADQRFCWNTTFHEANQLGVGPLFYYRLGVLGLRDYVPAEMAGRQKEELFSSQARNMKLYADVRCVLTALTKNGIQVAVLKGLALAEGAYDHIGLRTMADVDLLVKREDLEQTATIVEGLGFNANEGYRKKDWYKSHHHHLVPYVSPDGAMTIEIHRHIVERTASLDFPVNELWAHMKPALIASVPCLTLSLEHMLLHMALHISSPNRFQGQLRGLCDVAQLLRRFGQEIDWTEVMRITDLAQASKHVYCVLRLVEHVFGLTIPTDVRHRLRRQITFLPVEERLVKHITLNASLTVPHETERLYEWILLDLVRHLLDQRPYIGICRDLIKQTAARLKMRNTSASPRIGFPPAHA